MSLERRIAASVDGKGQGERADSHGPGRGGILDDFIEGRLPLDCPEPTFQPDNGATDWEALVADIKAVAK